MLKRFKYMRIQGRENSHHTGKPVGVFSLNWRRIRQGLYSKKDEEEFYQIDAWFKDNLPEPPYYAQENPQGAITYYKLDTFSAFEEQTKRLLNILDKYKIHYDIIFTNHVGKIIYEDEYQVGVIDI